MALHTEKTDTKTEDSPHPKVLGEPLDDPNAPVPGRPETYDLIHFAADPNKLPFPEEGGGELEVPLHLDSTAPPMFRAYNAAPEGTEPFDPRDGQGGETGTDAPAGVAPKAGGKAGRPDGRTYTEPKAVRSSDQDSKNSKNDKDSKRTDRDKDKDAPKPTAR